MPITSQRRMLSFVAPRNCVSSRPMKVVDISQIACCMQFRGGCIIAGWRVR